MDKQGAPEERVLQRMKKMLALARRGVGGERINAQRMLERLLAKYGMTLADMVDEQAERKDVRIAYKDNDERNLLYQIARMVFDSIEPQAWGVKGKRVLIFKATPGEHAELLIHFEAYRRQLAAELKKASKAAFSAFIIVNGVFPRRKDDAPKDEATLDEAELQAILNAARGMSKTEVRKAIGHTPAGAAA